MNDVFKVSVILPTKNRLSMLKKALASIFDQDYSCVEVIVVDDGSTDGTVDYLNELSSELNNVIVIFNDISSGACVSRNKAISRVSGYFVTCMDDDDYLKPNHISNLISCWSDEYSFVSANMVRIVKGQEIPFSYYSGLISLDKHLFYNRVGNHVLTLTSRLKSVGGFDEKFPAFQDYECWTRIIKAYGPAYRVPDCTYILDNQHGLERISSSSSRKIAGLDMFLSKHQKDIKPKHQRSLSLLRKRFTNEKITLSEVIYSLSMANVRFVISSYLSNFR